MKNTHKNKELKDCITKAIKCQAKTVPDTVSFPKTKNNQSAMEKTICSLTNRHSYRTPLVLPDTNGTVMCNSLAGRGLGVVCVLDDHCGMVAERIFHARVAWARRGYENSCRIRQSGKPIGRYR